MEFLFKSRGAGKRQVKPSQDIDMLADQIAGNQGDGSSDDSDFKIDDKSSDDEDESDSDAEVCIILQLTLNTFCQKFSISMNCGINYFNENRSLQKTPHQMTIPTKMKKGKRIATRN